MSEESGDPGEVERRAQRQRTLKAGLVAVADQFVTYNCIVKDISETGARIVLEDFVVLPGHFVLQIKVDGQKIDCERVWQKNLQCGVRFTGPWQATTRIAEQVLRDSRHALSERTLQDMEARQRALARAEDEERRAAASPQGRQPAVSPQRTFGKRSGPTE